MRKMGRGCYTYMYVVDKVEYPARLGSGLLFHM